MRKARAIIIPAILVIVAVLVYFYWANPITYFFVFILGASAYYFLSIISSENYVLQKFTDGGRRRAVFERHRIWKSGILLLLVFLISILVVWMYVKPSSHTPYFNNSDYHAIMNKGVAFDQELMLYTASIAPSASGVFQSETGWLKAKKADNGFRLIADEFLEPVFIRMDDRWINQNKIYPQAMKPGMAISNGTYDLRVLEISHPRGLWTTKKDRYNLRFQFSNLRTGYQDTIEISDFQILRGLALFDLILNIPKTKISFQKETTPGEMDRFLMETQGAMLLAERLEDKTALLYFPSPSAREKGYALLDGKQRLHPREQIVIPLQAEQAFFVGLKNRSKRNILRSQDSTAGSLLEFDYQKYYPLKASISKSQIGFSQYRFLANHYNQILEQNFKEGFLVNENVRQCKANNIHALINYHLGRPDADLAFSVHDRNSGKIKKYSRATDFYLESQDPHIKWWMEVKDFSEHKFQLSYIILYLSIILLLFLAVLFYFPSLYLTRIEPIVFIIIYGFIVFRFVLLWRVATFPPLNDIGNHELNTLINYDFNVLGFHLPIPNTVTITALFVLFIYAWRKTNLRDIIRVRPRIQSLQNAVFSRILPSRPTDSAAVQRENAMWRDILLFYLGGIVIYIFIKQLGIEFLYRIQAILYPLALYFVLNRKYYKDEVPAYQKKYSSKLIQYIQSFIYYLQANPSFYIAMATLVYFAVSDRGFGVVFLLFLFFKSIFFNFLAKPFSGSWRTMLLPRNYWIYALLSFVVVVVFIAWRGAFHFLLDYKLPIIGALSIFITLYMFLKDASKYRFRIFLGLSICVLCFLPTTAKYLDEQINENLKHVIYRAAIIHEPIEDLIYQNKASSFAEKKIYETAENQWFINSYLAKTYNNRELINLRPHFDSGVQYSTQTRDVVLPRFVISEHGAVAMFMLLLMLTLPILFFQISYGLLDRQLEKILVPNALAGKSLILFFSIGFFVWLTSTNRFVFFGQDFPFLSLTSKMSLLISFLVLVVILISKPKEKFAKKLDVNLGVTRQSVLYISLIIVMILAGRTNLLNSRNFVIDLKEPNYTINNKLNNLLTDIQLKNNFGFPDQSRTLDSLFASADFRSLYKNSSIYTRSVMDILRSTPSLARTTNSPIFLRFDNGKYETQYNRHLHLELPAYDNKYAWKGDILQYRGRSQDFDEPLLEYGNIRTRVNKPIEHFTKKGSGVVTVPNTWLPDGKNSMAIASLHNEKSTNKNSMILVYNPKKDRFGIQSMNGFAMPLHFHDVAIIRHGNQEHVLSINPNSQDVFMSNMWVNGRQRMMYPMSDQFFYIYHLSHSFRDLHKQKNTLSEDIELTLSYELQSKTQQIIDDYVAQNPIKNLDMSAIACDGNGEIYFMPDYNYNRIRIDPNNQSRIAKMKQDQFFYSSNSTERDQWANVNLIHMAYGPGSSIKPGLAAAISSQINAGWQDLVMVPSGVFAPSTLHGDQMATYEYAGLHLLGSLAWEDENSHPERGLTIDMHQYISSSSNFYNSLLMFLGSYPADSFQTTEGLCDLRRLLNTKSEKYNRFPKISYQEGFYYLPDFNKDEWPSSSSEKKQFFEMENSVIALGLNMNYGVIVDDEAKNDYILETLNKVNFTDLNYFDTLSNQTTAAAVWSFPEPSYFIQKDRAFQEKYSNFIMGIKNPSLGGAPWYITPLKMLEIYGSLYSQNNAYRAHITPQKEKYQKWNVHTSWNPSAYTEFLASWIYGSMRDVINIGTARGLKAVCGIPSNVYQGYHLYAKTGTIGSGETNSKRFILIISNKDLTDPANVSKAKFFAIYFVGNEIGNNNPWMVYKGMMDALINSTEFKNYMK